MRKIHHRILLLSLIVIMLFSMTLFAACSKKETGADNTQTAKSATPSAGSTPGPSNSSTAGTTASAGSSSTPAPSGSSATNTTGPSASNPPISNSKADYKIAYGNAVIDGTKDSSWDNAQVARVDNLKIGEENSDTEVIARVLWDEKGLYFSFEITDSDISTPNEIGHYNNDSIYIYIDEDQIYTNGFDSFVDGAYQFALLPNGKEKIPRYGEALPSGSYKFAYKMTNKGMFMEFFYKPTHAALKAGTEVFMDFQYNDANDGTRLGALGWYNDTDNNAVSELWGIAELIAKGVAVK